MPLFYCIPFYRTKMSNPGAAALIIPALNEEPVIGQLLASIPPELFRLVVVADNGSSDRTPEIARAAGALVTIEPERGYGATCLRAIASLPDSIDAVVFLQADCSEDPREARDLLAPIWEGRADLVIGSRTLGGAAEGSLLTHQKWGNHLLLWMIRILFGRRYTDLGPFRAIRLDALRSLNMRDRNYGWTVEMQVKAIQRRLRVLEVPVNYSLRAAGENKVSGNLWNSMKAGCKMIGLTLKLALWR